MLEDEDTKEEIKVAPAKPSTEKDITDISLFEKLQQKGFNVDSIKKPNPPKPIIPLDPKQGTLFSQGGALSVKKPK